MHIDIPPSLLARADEVIELVRPLCTDVAADAQVSSWHKAVVFGDAACRVRFLRGEPT